MKDSSSTVDDDDGKRDGYKHSENSCGTKLFPPVTRIGQSVERYLHG